MAKFEGRREYVQNVFYSVLETPHGIVLQIPLFNITL